MKRSLTFTSIAMVLVLGAGSAAAGGSASTFGVGAEQTLSGVEGTGMSISYDAGKFHAGGALSFRDESGSNNTDIGVAGRFFWHIHSTPMSDFSIGGNLGMLFDNEPDPQPDGSSATLIFLEPALQVRAFIANNVALSATAGISIGLGDTSGNVSLGGQLLSSVGVHYYFF